MEEYESSEEEAFKVGQSALKSTKSRMNKSSHVTSGSISLENPRSSITTQSASSGETSPSSKQYTAPSTTPIHNPTQPRTYTASNILYTGQPIPQSHHHLAGGTNSTMPPPSQTIYNDPLSHHFISSQQVPAVQPSNQYPPMHHTPQPAHHTPTYSYPSCSAMTPPSTPCDKQTKHQNANYNIPQNVNNTQGQFYHSSPLDRYNTNQQHDRQTTHTPIPTYINSTMYPPTPPTPLPPQKMYPSQNTQAPINTNYQPKSAKPAYVPHLSMEDYITGDEYQKPSPYTCSYQNSSLSAYQPQSFQNCYESQPIHKNYTPQHQDGSNQQSNQYPGHQQQVPAPQPYSQSSFNYSSYFDSKSNGSRTRHVYNDSQHTGSTLDSIQTQGSYPIVNQPFDHTIHYIQKNPGCNNYNGVTTYFTSGQNNTPPCRDSNTTLNYPCVSSQQKYSKQLSCSTGNNLAVNPRSNQQLTPLGFPNKSAANVVDSHSYGPYEKTPVNIETIAHQFPKAQRHTSSRYTVDTAQPTPQAANIASTDSIPNQDKSKIIPCYQNSKLSEEHGEIQQKIAIKKKNYHEETTDQPKDKVSSITTLNSQPVNNVLLEGSAENSSSLTNVKLQYSYTEELNSIIENKRSISTDDTDITNSNEIGVKSIEASLEPVESDCSFSEPEYSVARYKEQIEPIQDNSQRKTHTDIAPVVSRYFELNNADEMYIRAFYRMKEQLECYKSNFYSNLFTKV